MIGAGRFISIFSFFAICALAASEPVRAADGIEVKVAKGDASEQYERDVDEVALSAQEKAISRLQALLVKYRGTRQEPILLAKMGDLQQQAAAIAFRLSHGRKSKKGAEARYQKVINASIQTYSTLIAKYPHYQEVPHAYFARGKSYEELGQKAKATSDYLHLVKNHPDAEEAPTAYMSLAEFAIQDNDHAKAIPYLKEVEKNPDGSHFPFALYKLAWAYYNLKNIPAALSYAERQIAFYNTRGVKGEGSSASDAALRENTLMDVAIFYFEGYEQKAPAYQLTHAYPYFSKIESGPTLGKMLVRFSKLLRSHGHETDLVAFKDELLEKEADRPETLDVILTTYEFQLNKRRFQQLVESAQDMVRFYARSRKKDPEGLTGAIKDGFGRAQKLVLETAENLQSLIIKNKSADDVRTYSVMLASLYDSFTRIVEETDERIPRVHYNLAETLFAIKDFSGATDHYRWVVDRGSWKESSKVANVIDASLKAIASRYEVLREKKLIPTELAARALTDAKPPTLEPLLAQWIEWLDTHLKHSNKDTDNFYFEANRALYSHGHVQTAVERLHAFAKKNPESAFGTSSASLVLDTYIASENWERTHELTTELLKNKNWKSEPVGAFSKRLAAVAADSFYKQVELKHKANDLPGTLKLADQFLERYGESARLPDTLTVAGAAALALKDKVRAEGYFSRLIRQAGTDKSISASNLGTALLARAALAEENYRFAEAAADYRRTLELPAGAVKMSEKQALEMRKKTLALIWLSDDFAELRKALSTKSFCDGDAMSSECEKYSALAVLSSPERASQQTTEEAFDKARKGSAKEARAIWAVVALEGAKNLAFRDRNVALRTFASSWDDLDPMVRFALLPSVSASVPKAFELNRHALRDVAPLRADERYITRRVEVIREMENAATKIVKLPWARLKAQTLNEIAETYLDFARGLTGLKPPKGLSDAELAAYGETIRKLVLPFEEKGQEMRSKAFELASRSAIEEESLQKISDPFFAENPSQAKKLRLSAPVARAASLDLPLMTQLDPDGSWKQVRKALEKDDSKLEDAATRVKVLWARALEGSRYAQIAFFLNEAQEKSFFSKGTLSAIKAVSLARAGAKAEALSELDEMKKELSFEGRMTASTLLMHHYLSAFNREKTRNLYKGVESELSALRDAKKDASVPSDLAKEQSNLNSIATSAVQ